MKVKSQSEVAESCPTLSNLMDCSLPGSSVYGIFQARVLEWGAIAFSMAASPGLYNGNTEDTASLDIHEFQLAILKKIFGLFV